MKLCERDPVMLGRQSQVVGGNPYKELYSNDVREKEGYIQD